ncbi:MAG: GntR family transcriptional regulator [Lachnospiraceae bacterium]|nr:GntR family transcriptional regulator [Lachnospiraceae bacterium]
MPIPENFSTPARTSAKDRAFSQLQTWIIDGTLKGGEKLNDTELSKALGISRTPVREALQLLANQGFVEMYPGKETKVTVVDPKDISKVLPPLSVLQALSAELAAPIIEKNTIEQLCDINKAFANAIQQSDYYTALKLDEHFHESIVNTINNPYMTNIITMLQAHVRRLFFYKAIVLTKASIEEHELIIQAFRDRDKELAAKIMKSNWLRPNDEFGSEIQ